jgi:sulfur-oxidizing protein SoxX
LLIGTLLAGCAVQPAMTDRMDTALAAPGDAARGREVFMAREAGHCVLCHAAPGVGVAGNVGPSLAGVGSRLTAAQIRLRVVDISRVNPDAAMPSFYRPYKGTTALSARQVEDVVAWLATLR